MQYILLPVNQAKAILAYLERCPYREVADGVAYLAIAMQNPIDQPDSQPKEISASESPAEA